MRFLLAGFVLVSIAFVSTLGARPNINNLGNLLSELSQLHGVIDHIDTYIPQIHQILTSSQFSSFKDKVTQAVISGIASHGGINAIHDKIQALLQQQFPQVLTRGFDFGGLLQAITSVLPHIVNIVSAIGKRDVDSNDLSERSLQQLFNLADKLNLNNLIPQVQGLLDGTKFQELQNQFFNLVSNFVNGQIPSNSLAQTIQALVTQFVPQAGLMRINWNDIVGVVQTVASVAGPLIGIASLFGKRDLPQERVDFQQLINMADTLNLNNLIPQIQGLLDGTKFQELQNQFLNLVSTFVNDHIPLNNFAQMVQALVTQFVPQAGLMRINWNNIIGAVNTAVSVAKPVISIISLFGKRDLPQERIDVQQLLSTLPVDKVTQLVQTIMSYNNGLGNVLTKLRSLLQQFFPQYQGRINFDQLAQNAFQTLIHHVPAFNSAFLQQLFQGVGKRDVSELLNLASSLDITHLIPQIQELVNNIDLQQLQKQFLTLIATSIANHMNNNDLGQMILALVQQFVPSIGLQRGINWGQIASIASSAASVIIPIVSMLG